MIKNIQSNPWLRHSCVGVSKKNWNLSDTSDSSLHIRSSNYQWYLHLNFFIVRSKIFNTEISSSYRKQIQIVVFYLWPWTFKYKDLNRSVTELTFGSPKHDQKIYMCRSIFFCTIRRTNRLQMLRSTGLWDSIEKVTNDQDDWMCNSNRWVKKWFQFVFRTSTQILWNHGLL